ncbi:MAG: fibrobacter succinogenes major paralogous domain-containing protein [Fibrobacter sp.]|nr:fibrobacter succinogenes major paralogous domain-containing protein [Fibrobacter sp.]
MRSFFIVQIVLAFGLVGCGGDSGSTSGQSDNETSDSDLVKSTFDDLPVCTAKREGATAYIKNEKIAYVCENGKWVEDSDVVRSDDSREESCDSRSGGSSSSVILSSVSHEEFSSSSSVEQNSSATLLDGGWNWNVPKESRLNQEITYGTMTDSRDNKVYKIVKIGDQTWMAENLNYADSVKTPSLLKRNWCYDDKVENCVIAGRLYTWAAAIDSVALYDDGNGVDCGYGKTCTLPAKVQGVCPDGWHLPTKTEWTTLFTEVGEGSAVNKILKSTSGWNNNGNGTDAYGFSALPTGHRSNDGYFCDAGYLAYFWSASNIDSFYAFSVFLYYGNDGAVLLIKNLGFSVRCIKD